MELKMHWNIYISQIFTNNKFSFQLLKMTTIELYIIQKFPNRIISILRFPALKHLQHIM